jgi:hypothetical protein
VSGRDRVSTDECVKVDGRQAPGHSPSRRAHDALTARQTKAPALRTSGPSGRRRDLRDAPANFFGDRIRRMIRVAVTAATFERELEANRKSL